MYLLEVQFRRTCDEKVRQGSYFHSQLVLFLLRNRASKRQDFALV